MQKTLDILEKNVQWFALGLGGIFLLWVVWSYLITPPATVSLDRKTYGPGEVADVTANGPVRDIQTQIDGEKQVPPIAVADVIGPWKSRMQPVIVTAPELAPYAFSGETQPAVAVPTGPGDTTVSNPTGAVAAVPQLPKAAPMQSQSGLSVASLPPPANAPVIPATAHQPSNDLVWVSEAFTVPADKIKTAFAAPLKGRMIPQGLYSTTILQVVLQRQRATGVDSSTNQPTFPADDQGVEDVPPPATVKGDIQPLPPASASMNAKYGYIDWAQKNQADISQPPFYVISAGDPYTIPQEAPPAVATPGSAPGMQNQPPANSAPVGAGRSAMPPALFGSPSAQANAYSGFSQTDRQIGHGTPGANGGFNPFNPNAGNANSGSFDPLNLTSDLLIWAHDDTAKPGDTYRYRVVYKLKNPLFGSAGVATKQVSDEFILVSPPSDWTQAVAVPQMTKFWIASYRHEAGALMDIFHWAGGVWTQKPQLISPGDRIPGTDWTMVDVRAGTGNFTVPEKDKYVLLTDDSGVLIRRSMSSDMANPDYQNLKDLLNPNKNATGGNGTRVPGQRPTERRSPPPDRRLRNGGQ